MRFIIHHVIFGILTTLNTRQTTVKRSPRRENCAPNQLTRHKNEMKSSLKDVHLP